ncbi:MAG: redoxin family protein [Saprospiraceae bacterium]
MKKLFVLFFPAFLFIACQNTETSNAVTITGTIENPVSENASIRYGDSTLTADVIDGKFILNFELTQPEMITFQHGAESGGLYLEPGDNVTLTLNPEQFDETLKLAGEGAEESNYLLAKYLLNEKYNEKMKDIYSSTPTEFAASMDKIKMENEQHLDTYSKAHQNMNSDFIKNEKSTILYTWATDKINYPSYYPYYAGADAPELELGDDYLSFMDKIDLNDETAFESNRKYAQLVNTYINGMGQKAGKGLDNLAGMFEAANDKISSNKIKSGILSKTLTNFLNYNDATGTEKYVDMFNKMSTDEKQKKAIAMAQETAMKLLKGKPAPTFNYTNTKGEMVPLENLKGKSVYVDVWATWCGPCKREIPHLKELEAKYHKNEDIVFMSVSIDKMEDKEKWLKMVEEKELSGVQLMADKDWKSSICKDYAIRGIPRFLLIDKDGNIMDKNAPRPSSKEIKEVMADLAQPKITSMK